MITSEELLYCVTINTIEQDVAIIEEMVSVLDLEYSSVIDVDLHTGKTLVICHEMEVAKEVKKDILASLPDWQDMLDNKNLEVSIEEVKREDWAESWKQYFKPFRVSRRLVIKPTWEDYEASVDDIILEIDPGMSFGTGHHGTTKAVLQFLDELRDELGSVPFLDAGSGSGILTLAALKLGYSPVEAFDYDPDAVKCTEENLELAGYNNVLVSCSDVATYIPNRQVQLAVVNILAVVLLENVSHIVSFLDRNSSGNSYLVLSGILNEQYEEVREKYESRGLTEVKRLTLNEWTSGVFRLNK